AKVHDQDLGILPGTDYAPIVALGAEHPAGVPTGKVEHLAPRRHVPNFDVGVVAAADEAPAHAVNVQAANQVVVGAHLLDALARVGVPDADGLVVSCGRNVSPVLRELRASQSFSMALELPDVLPRVDIPELDLEVARA